MFVKEIFYFDYRVMRRETLVPDVQFVYKGLPTVSRQLICPIVYNLDRLNPTQHASHDICYLYYIVLSLVFEIHFLCFLLCCPVHTTWLKNLPTWTLINL